MEMRPRIAWSVGLGAAFGAAIGRGAGTLWGIAAGVACALFCFGCGAPDDQGSDY